MSIFFARTRQPFVALACLAAVGIAAADRFPAFTFPVAVVIVLGLIAVLLFPFTPLFFATVCAAFFCIHSARISHPPAEVLTKAVGESVRPISVDGLVATEPKMEANGSTTFILQLRSLRLDGETISSDARVLVRWRRNPSIGDELELFGTIQPIETPRNPGEFDMRAYLAREGVNRIIVVRYPANGRVLRSGSPFSLRRTAAQSRQWMQQTLSLGIESSPDVTGLICGTALGLRHQARDDIEEPFQQTGTLHLFAVAGLHVGIVGWLLWTIANMLRLPRKVSSAAIIPLLFFYAAITGLHTASLRAAIMAAVLLGGIFFDRKVFALNSLAAAAFLILIIDSNELFTPGFQLSFSVVGAIILLTEPLFARFRRISDPDPFLPRVLLSRFRRSLGAIGTSLARGGSVSFAAATGSLPLIYWYFHLLTPISLAANVAIVPLAYFVLALAMLSLIAAPVSPSLSLIFNNANWLLSKLVLALVQLFAAVPLGHFYLEQFNHRHPSPGLTVLDEGTGGAAYIRANGYDWLIDCGSERTYGRTLKPFLHGCGVDRLEGLVLTHGDAQHIGAGAMTAADFGAIEIYNNPLDVRSMVQRRMIDSLARRRKFPRPLRRDDTLVFGPGVRGRIFYPRPNLTVAAADDAPLIVQLTIGQTSVLFESDAGPEAEAELVQSEPKLRSDIVVKGQYYAGGSGTLEFLSVVQPKLIVATCGEKPLAEKIDESWASNVSHRGIKLFRQDKTGAVEFIFRNDGWMARAYVTGEVFSNIKR